MDLESPEQPLKYDRTDVSAQHGNAAEQIALAAAGSHTAAHTVSSESSSTATSVTSSAGSNRRPFIVPTVVLENGIREVPRRFEQCELEDLVTLIGQF